MTDFTIRVKNLPHHALYNNNDDLLRAILTAHFEDVIKDEMQQRRKNADLMGEDEDDFDDLSAIKPTIPMEGP
jgi:hypothetical protein